MDNFASAKSVFAPCNSLKNKGELDVVVQTSYPASIYLLKIYATFIHKRGGN